MDLFLIRHAQSFNNTLADPAQRMADPDLTELGQRQAARVAEHLANGANRAPQWRTYTATPDSYRGVGYGITRLVSSPMWRALQTAQAIQRTLNLPLEVWPDIHEHGGIYLDQGDLGPVGLPGKTRREILAGFPGALVPETITEAGWWASREYESWEQCRQRGARVAEMLFQHADSDERIALVSHGGFLDALLKALVRPAVVDAMNYHHYNTGITHARLTLYRRVDLFYLNRVDHLEPELVS